MTKCQICSKEGVDHDEIVNKCKSSPYWVGRLILDYDLFANPLHFYLNKWFVDRWNAGKKRFIIIIPRDHLKTSLFGICLILWRIINNPEERILYLMANSTNAEATLGVVKDIVANNEQFQHFFPERCLNLSNRSLNHKSTEQKLRLSREGKYRECTVESRGMNSAITGGHFNLHIIDDPIDEQMVESETVQSQIVDKVKRADAMFVNKREDVEVHIGTRWPGPYYKWLLDESGIVDTYETCILGCYVDERYREWLASMGLTTTQEDGEPIWPDHFDLETLDEIALKAGPFNFGHQWLNLEISDEERRFREEDIRYYTALHDRDAISYERFGKTKVIPISSLYRTLTIDPATGEGKRTDESAITVSGYDRRTGDIFILETWSKRALPFDLNNKIVEMTKRWEPHKVCPEDASYQKTLKHYLKQAMKDAGVYAKIEPAKPGSKSKGTRILDSLQPFIANHQVFFLRGIQQQPAIKELVSMQVVGGKVVGKSPNLADSLAYHAPYWTKGVVTNKDEHEIRYVEPWAEAGVVPAYGLSCST